MASSNRHWPSMFKSKPTYTTNHQDHHQWQTTPHHHAPPATLKSYTSGNDERTPEPKPRWNPKPEQIRILESIFNSGLVNPPRDEIRRIRARLQEYGQVGDANVFYWFQNRKSRSKHKNRHLAKSQTNQTQSVATKAVAATTSSSSSSDKSSSKSIEFFLNSPTVSVNQPQTFFAGGAHSQPHQQQHHGEFFQEPYFFPVGQTQQQAPSPTSFTQGFCFSELGSMISSRENHHHQTVVSSSEMLLTDLMINHQYGNPSKNNSKNKEIEEESIMKMFTTPSTSFTPPPQPLTIPSITIAPSTTINDIQGVEELETGKTIVFINDMPFEVAVGPFNVKEAFGGDAVLIDSSGQTVVTNEWGVTVQSLQHGAFYYLVRPAFTYDHNAATTTVDLI
uniref:WUSCHEL-related homeobox 9-like n=1 Tax=Erigeron canadensis TaxID=72917 RepID=UPI001CB93B1D|nr:WUSCHEL-related homeobox 9-like [Erigeron canadensis]